MKKHSLNTDVFENPANYDIQEYERQMELFIRIYAEKALVGVPYAGG